MSLDTALENIESLFSSDPDMTSWAQTFGGQSLTFLYGSVAVGSETATDLPAVVATIGAGELTPQLSNSGMSSSVNITLSFRWEESDTALAFEANKQLFELVPNVLMKDSTLSGAVDWAYVGTINSDDAVNAPRRFMDAVIMLELSI